MEMNSAYWLDTNHPNYKRWKRSRELSLQRGNFVKEILSPYLNCEKLIILDLGSGEGGTTKVFDEQNTVISVDFDQTRLKTQQTDNKLRANGEKLPFAKNSFDLIIIQDVIEHVNNPEILLNEVYRVLKPSGFVYISSPNKFSFLNILSDPHWGFPFVALLKRDKIKSCFLKYFRKAEINRQGIAQLLSLNDFQILFGNDFFYKLNTKKSVKLLFENHKGIVWSGFHLAIIKTIKNLKLSTLILKIANDEISFMNKYFTPTFYFVLKKSVF